MPVSCCLNVVDLFRRGYLIVDITKDRAQAEWYHVRTITERKAEEDFARALRTESGSNRLIAADPTLDRFAVRSSAAAEDRSDISFAGPFD